jgi:hypothetical protein
MERLRKLLDEAERDEAKFADDLADAILKEVLVPLKKALAESDYEEACKITEFWNHMSVAMFFTFLRCLPNKEMRGTAERVLSNEATPEEIETLSNALRSYENERNPIVDTDDEIAAGIQEVIDRVCKGGK